MKIGYNRAIAIPPFFLSLHSLCAGVAMAVFNQNAPLAAVGTAWVGVLCSVLFTVFFGVLFLTRSYFEVTQNELVIKPLVGWVTRRIPFSSPRDFSVEGKSIYITRGDTRQKVNVVHWLADQNGWNAFVQWIGNS